MITEKSLLKSFKWESINSIINFSLSILYFFIITRLVDKEEFGTYAIIISIIGLCQVIGEGGMGTALIHKKNIDNKDVAAAFFFNCLVGLIFAIILFFISGFIGEFYNENEIDDLVKILSFLCILMPTINVLESLFRKELDFKTPTIIKTVSDIIAYFTGILMANYGYGIYSLIAVIYIQVVLKNILLIYFSQWRLINKFTTSHLITLSRYGMGIVLNSILTYISSRGTSLILGKIIPISSLGVYDRILRIKDIPTTMVGNVMDKVTFSQFAIEQNNISKITEILSKRLAFSWVLLIPIVVIFIIDSSSIVLTLMGEKWKGASVPLTILICSIPFSNSVRLFDSVLKSIGKLKKLNTCKFLFTLIVLFFVTILSKKFGLNGACLGILISFLIYYVFLGIFIGKELETSWFSLIKNSLKFGGLFLITTLAVYGLINLISINILQDTTLKLIINLILYLFFITLILNKIPKIFISIKNLLT